MSDPAPQQGNKPPDVQAEASPLNGVIPPPEHRFKPGQSGNPKGRPSAGASIREWFNELQNATETELEQIARDTKAVPSKRAAAIQWLDILAAAADLSDVESYTEGTVTLAELKRQGIAVRAIRKAKETRRTSKDGEETRREVELSERGSQALDRIMDRTSGKPHQSLDLTSQGESVRQVLVVGPQLNIAQWSRQQSRRLDDKKSKE